MGALLGRTSKEELRALEPLRLPTPRHAADRSLEFLQRAAMALPGLKLITGTLRIPLCQRVVRSIDFGPLHIYFHGLKAKEKGRPVAAPFPSARTN